jgi:glycosyltransferase involved in cell wall biosynthesis
MRVALVNNLHKETGMGRYAFELYDALKDKCDIEHVFFNYSERTMQRVDGVTEEIIAKSVHVPLIDNKPFFWYRLRNKIPEFDVYHITNQNIAFLARKNTVITCHDIFGYYRNRLNMFEFHGRKSLYSGVNRAAKIIVDSKQGKEDVLYHYKISGDKVVVTPLAVSRRVFRKISIDGLKKDSSQPIILHVGPEAVHKNVASLIRALYELRKAGLNVKLIRVGNKSKEIARIINRYRLESNVEYRNNVNDEELVELYNMADVFVFPSFYEGFGLPVLEAMACGCPVVTSNTPSLLNVAGEAAITVDPKDGDGLTRAIMAVLTDRELRKRLIDSGMARVELFSWDKTAKETLKIYEEVIQAGKRLDG